jgi:hypothetical protein
VTVNVRTRARWAPGPAGWMLLCLLLPTLVYVWAVREPPPRWRASYFSDAPPGGEPVLALTREERDVNYHDYHWSDASALTGIPENRSSVLWESCLILERTQSVAFQLTSHDHARLFIDGRRVIDNLGRRPLPLTQGTNVSLGAGVHHLRVEYHEQVKSAALTLLASFDGTRPRRIAPKRLRFPNEDPRHPCRTESTH